MSLKLITTSDGSHTLFNEELNEHYHSVHGSIQESKHVFIKNGLEFYLITNTPNEINILEVGLGTGLNAILTLQYSSSVNLLTKINYTALEPFPVKQELIDQLNYNKLLQLTEKEKNGFKKIHSCAFDKINTIAENFDFEKHKQTLQEINFTKNFDLVFYDAFGPRAQAEMWEKHLFEKIFSAMNKNAVFVTYCAKGELKRNLKSVGFIIESLPGPPGKREMVRAHKK